MPQATVVDPGQGITLEFFLVVDEGRNQLAQEAVDLVAGRFRRLQGVDVGLAGAVSHRTYEYRLVTIPNQAQSEIGFFEVEE